ncbi:MAG: hypothetical protein SFU53_00960 [Terrimicrobiaceae bacterium]|nr:hypothetical protein [Terrimicrobiaceae bacterium]
MRIVVTGLVGQYAFGGVTWDYLQYVLGFQRLGHEVWYLEDSSVWPYDPIKQEPGTDCSHNVRYLERVMNAFDLGDRWIYRNGADGAYHGISDASTAERLLRSADVLANVSGACWLREPTAAIPLKLFLDGDPMFTQIDLVDPERRKAGEHIRAHDRHFSFGLHIGHPGCHVPTGGLNWRPTVQPVALDWWERVLAPEPDVAAGAWTTVMNWASYKPRAFHGETYGQKDIEFMRFTDLPRRCGERFVLAMGQGVGQSRPTALLEDHGWTIVEPDLHLPDFESYHAFLRASKAEWSIAKNGYVHSRSGWFSCRSACYLAAGKPVVVQDTGWTDHLPSGEGVLAFTTLDEAADAIARVSSDYLHHCEAARAYARKHFDAAKVCAELLE